MKRYLNIKAKNSQKIVEKTEKVFNFIIRKMKPKTILKGISYLLYWKCLKSVNIKRW